MREIVVNETERKKERERDRLERNQKVNGNLLTL